MSVKKCPKKLPNVRTILGLFGQNVRSKFQSSWNPEQFGSRSGPTFCQAWSGSKIFAKVISRWQKLPLAGKEINKEQRLDTTFWLKPWLKSIMWQCAIWFQIAYKYIGNFLWWKWHNFRELRHFIKFFIFFIFHKIWLFLACKSKILKLNRVFSRSENILFLVMVKC